MFIVIMHQEPPVVDPQKKKRTKLFAQITPRGTRKQCNYVTCKLRFGIWYSYLQFRVRSRLQVFILDVPLWVIPSNQNSSDQHECPTSPWMNLHVSKLEGVENLGSGKSYLEFMRWRAFDTKEVKNKNIRRGQVLGFLISQYSSDYMNPQIR